MHICFTLSSLACGGAERVASTLANNFCKQGHKVSIVLVSIDHNNTFYKLDKRIKVYPLLKTSKDKSRFRRVKILKEKLLRIKPNVVISFLPHICIYTHFALKNTNIRHICSERNDPNQYSWFRKILLKRVFKKADGCIFQTQDARNFYKKVSDEKSSIIFNPVFLLNDAKKPALNREKLFISVGRLEKQKNFEFLISTFVKFHSKHPSYKLAIYGDGSLKNKLLKQIRKNNANKYITIFTSNKNWQMIARKAEGFVSTSSYEGMPNCLEEALCLGCNCIATDCPIGGSRALIELLNSGILINPNSEDELLRAMEKVRKAKVSKKIKYSMLLPDAIATQWLEFIENVAVKKAISEEKLPDGRVKAFFKGFSKISLANYLIIVLFLGINVANYIISSFTTNSKIEAFSSSLAYLSKYTPDETINLSFTKVGHTHTSEFEELASYSYSQSTIRTDKVKYETRVIGNHDYNDCTSIDIQGLDKKAIAVFCKVMNNDKDDTGLTYNLQTNLRMEFDKSGSNNYNGEKTNYIYIRESTANRLVNDPKSPYYGLSHEDLLGKGLDVSIKNNNEKITAMWKIENIILEKVNGEIEPHDFHLHNLYGEYYLSSIYYHQITTGFSVDFEMSTNVIANARNIKRAIEKVGNDQHFVTVCKSNVQDLYHNKIDQLNRSLPEALTSGQNNYVAYIIFGVTMAFNDVLVYLYFSYNPTLSRHNYILFCLSFVIPYGIAFVLNKVNPYVYAKFFSTAGILMNLLLTIFTILFVYVAKYDSPELNLKIEYKKAKGRSKRQ